MGVLIRSDSFLIHWIDLRRTICFKSTIHKAAGLLLRSCYQTICDNYAPLKPAKVKAWLTRNRRFHVHFTPTSASWPNMVERFFRDITDKSVRRGVFGNTGEPTQAITDCINARNANPEPFIRAASAADILEKVKRERRKPHKLQSARRTTLATGSP